MEYIFSQIFVVLSYALLGVTYFVKNRRLILIYSVSSLVANAISYFFLGAWSGLVMCGVALLRNAIFLIQNKKNKSEKITWVDWIILGVLVIVSIVSAVLTYDGFLSLFSVFATMLYTISVWQKNVKVYKIMGIFVSILWIVYNSFIFSIFGIVLECVLLISEIVGSVKYIKDEKTKLKENENLAN